MSKSKSTVKREGRRFVLNVSEREAWAIHEVLGMVGGKPAFDAIDDQIDKLFGAPADIKFIGWLAEQRKRLRVRKPFINHAGVITFDEPGEHGEHNRSHFPCGRGAK